MVWFEDCRTWCLVCVCVGEVGVYEPETVSLCLFTDVPFVLLGPVLVGMESRHISELERLT